MQLYVRQLTGGRFTLDVELSNTIRDVKVMIQEKENIPWQAQMLIFAGRLLEDAKTLGDYNMQKDSTCHLMNKLPTIRAFTVKLRNSKKVKSLESLPVSLETHNLPKTAEPGGYEFEPAFFCS